MDAQTPMDAEKSKIVEDWARRLQMAVIGCAVYYDGQEGEENDSRSNEAFYTLLKEKLRGSLTSCVALHEQAYDGWFADGANVGFMVKIEDASFLRAPVHLVPLIPDKRFATKIWRLSNEVRLSKQSILALSGSNAVRRVFEHVDDVDFFEYVPDQPEDIKETITDRLFQSEPLFCERAKLGQLDFSSPFEKEPIEAAILSLSADDPKLSSVKLDYLTMMVEDRPFEVTNISAFVGRDFDGVAKQSTYPFQEILLSQKEIVPTQLDDPMQVGEYVCWLLSQIDEHQKEKNHLKAAKRALSLARFCWFDDEVNALHSLFENTVAVHQAEIRATELALERVNEDAGFPNPAGVDDIKDRLSILTLERDKKKIIEKKKFPGGFDDGASQIISDLISKVFRMSGGSIGNA